MYSGDFPLKQFLFHFICILIVLKIEIVQLKWAYDGLLQRDTDCIEVTALNHRSV